MALKKGLLLLAKGTLLSGVNQNLEPLAGKMIEFQLLTYRIRPKLSKSLASRVQAGTDSSYRHIHDLGDLFIAQLLHLAKNKRRSQVIGQLLKQLLNHDLVFHEGTAGRLSAVELRNLRLARTQTIHAQADTDSVQVPAEGTIVPQLRKLAEGFNERILRNILGFVTISQ